MKMFLGTSGWSYKDWVGNFYPPDTAASSYLKKYAAILPTVEIDSTFYGIPRASTVEKWRDETPADFMFSAKVPQSITHEKSLRDCGEEMTAFVKRMAVLGDKLGPLLLQFPYGFKYECFDDLQAFLPMLPADFSFAVEVRHKSWLNERFYDLLRAHGTALVLIDHPWMPRVEVVTAAFTYIRWLGDRKAVTEPFDQLRLDRRKEFAIWKRIIEKIATEDLVVYGYFNNHYAGHSPTSLNIFREMFYGAAK